MNHVPGARRRGNVAAQSTRSLPLFDQVLEEPAVRVVMRRQQFPSSGIVSLQQRQVDNSELPLIPAGQLRVGEANAAQISDRIGLPTGLLMKRGYHRRANFVQERA